MSSFQSPAYPVLWPSVLWTMVRNYVRKTTRRAPLIGVLNAARDQVRCGVSVRKAAEDYGLQFMTLWRHCHADGEDGHRTFGYVKKTVLSPEMERKLGEYLQTASQLNYGLTPRETRQLAYKFAVANKLRVPPSWDRKSEAGIDWFLGFMKRQSYLSTRKPQATSLARASAFNKVTVNRFFDLLGQVYDKHKFEPKDVWNMDETGVTTCHTPQKVIATKGARQVSGATSAERGTLVTVAVAVNAVGNCMPPHFVFPRAKFHDFFLNGAPPGSTGSANPSGWMTEAGFMGYIQHFHEFTRSSPENPCLLVMDNHVSHTSLSVINFCRANGIVLLTIPPHTSHRLQPLDRTVFGPLKNYVNESCADKMRSQAGRPLTIYDIPAVVQEAMPRAVSIANVCKGFACTGIFPYRRSVFDDSMFTPSAVTDREDPSATAEDVRNEEAAETPATCPGPRDPQDTSAHRIQSEQPQSDGEDAATPEGVYPPRSRRQLFSRVSVGEAPGTSGLNMTPEMVKPLPKARPRKASGRGRKRKTSEVLTSTPVKERLESEQKKVEEEKKKTAKKASNKRETKNSKRTSETVSANADVHCLICGMRYSFSSEEWIQCQSCHNWACLPCTDVDKGQAGYVCEFCR